MRFRLLVRFLVIPALLVMGALAVHTTGEDASVAEAQGDTGSGTGCISNPGFFTCPTNTPTVSIPTSTRTATATATSAATSTQTRTATATPLPQDLALTKSVNGLAPGVAASVSQGATVTFTLAVTNAGGSTSLATSVLDTIPAGLGNAAAQGNCVILNNVLNCNVGALAPGASVSFTFTARVDGQGTIVNTAQVVPPKDLETNVNNNTASATINVGNTFTPTPTATSTPTNTFTPTNTPTPTPFVDLAVSKTSNVSTVLPGGAVQFTILVRNIGTKEAQSVVVTDTLATGTTPTVVSPADPACAIGGQLVTCTFTSMGAGDVLTIVVTATVNLTSGCFQNTASVTTSSGDTNGANNTAVLANPVCVNPPALSITKSFSQGGIASPSSVIAGLPVTFTISVTNAVGAGTASGVSVTDAVPAAFTVNSSSPSQGSCSGSQTVVCALGSLAGGQSATVTIVATPFGSGTSSNSASVTNTTDNTTQTSNSVSLLIQGPNLQVSKTASGSLVAGGLITYAISVRNVGHLDANVNAIVNLIRDYIGDDGATGAPIPTHGGGLIVSVIPDSGGQWSCSNPPLISTGGEQFLNCHYAASDRVPAGVLHAGASTNVLQVVVAAPQLCPKIIRNFVRVDPDGNLTEEVESDNTAFVDSSITCSPVLPGGPSLSISKSVNAIVASIPAPTVLTYTINVSNSTATANNVVITDAFPPGVTSATVTSKTPSSIVCTTTDPLTCTVGNMAAGGTAQVVFTMTINGSAVGICNISNTASAAGTNTSQVQSTASNQCAGIPGGGSGSGAAFAADMQIVKTSSANGLIAPGATVTYTYVITNNGPGVAGSQSPLVTFQLTDTFDSDLNVIGTNVGTSLFTCTVTPNNPPPAVLTCNRAQFFQVNEPATLTVVVQPKPTLTDCSLDNTTARIAFVPPNGQVDPIPGNNTAQNQPFAVACPDLSISKTLAPGQPTTGVNPGGHLTYTIFVSNTGPVAVNGATVTDTAGANITLDSASVLTPFGTCTLNAPPSTVATCTGLGPFPANTNSVPAVVVVASVSLTPTSACVATNGATVGGLATPEITLGNNGPSSVSVPIATCQANIPAALTVSKTGTVDPQPNSDVIYTINVQNTGGQPATNVVVVDHLESAPPGPQMVAVGVIGATCTPAVPVSSNAAAHPIIPGYVNSDRAGPHADLTCNLGTIAGGQTVSFQVVARVPANAPCSSVIRNTAVVTAAAGIPINNNAATFVGGGVDCPNISVTKSTNIPNPSTGSLLTYTVTVTNNGTATYAPVSVVDHLDQAIGTVVPPLPTNCTQSSVAAHLNPTIPTNHIDVTCTAPSLAAGASITREIIVITPNEQGILTNIACAKAAPATNVPIDVCSSILNTPVGATIGVDMAARFCLNNTVVGTVNGLGCSAVNVPAPQTIVAGGTMILAVRAGNISLTHTFNSQVPINITLPSTLSFPASPSFVIAGSNFAAGGTCFRDTAQTAHCNVQFDANDVATITVTVNVASALPGNNPCGGITGLSVTIDPNDIVFEINEFNNTDGSGFTITPACPDLTISKSISPTVINNAVPFDPPVTFTLTISNTGTVASVAFPQAGGAPILIDHMPTGLAVQSITTTTASLTCLQVAVPGGTAGDPVVVGHQDIVCYDSTGLLPGQTEFVTISLTIPQSSPKASVCGLQTNFATIDPNNIQAETSESNSTTATYTVNCADIDIFEVDDPGDQLNTTGNGLPANVAPLVGSQLSIITCVYPAGNQTGGVPAGLACEDMNSPAGITSLKQYVLINDGVEVTHVTFTGAITGGVTRTGGAISIQGGGGTWQCAIDIPAGTWTCSGTLAPDNGIPGDNTANGPDIGGDEVRITLMVLGTGTVGQQVIYTPTAVTCTNSGPCTDDTPSRANADGSDLLIGTPNTDTVVAPNLTIAKTPATQTINNAGGAALVTFTVTVTNTGNAPTTANFASPTNPIMVDHLPAGLGAPTFNNLTGANFSCTFVASPAATAGDPVAVAHTDVRCFDSDGLAPAEFDSVEIIVSITAPAGCGTLTNTAFADPNNVQPESIESSFALPIVITGDNIAQTTVTINCADLDIGHSNDLNPPVGQEVVPGVVEDLNPIGGYLSTKRYILWNDGVQAIGNVTFTGTIGGTAAATIENVQFQVVGGTAPWVCSFNNNAAGPWSCTGGLSADPAPNDDGPSLGAGPGSVLSIAAGAPGQSTSGVGPGVNAPCLSANTDTVCVYITTSSNTAGAGNIGQTITYTADLPVCTNPGPCTSGVASPANSDGVTLATPVNTDLLDAPDLAVCAGPLVGPPAVVCPTTPGVVVAPFSKTGPATVPNVAGSPIAYTVTLRNTSATASVPPFANPLLPILRDAIPAGTTFASLGAATGSGFSCALVGTNIDCIDTNGMGPGGNPFVASALNQNTQVINVTLTAVAVCASTITNTAVADPLAQLSEILEGAPPVGNNSSPFVTTVVCADLDVVFFEETFTPPDETLGATSWRSEARWDFTNDAAAGMDIATGMTLVFHITSTGAVGVITIQPNAVANSSPTLGCGAPVGVLPGTATITCVSTAPITPGTTLTVRIIVAGTGGTAGASITYLEEPPICLPLTAGVTSCLDGVSSPSNSDGSDLTQPNPNFVGAPCLAPSVVTPTAGCGADTDTLVADADLDVSFCTSGTGACTLAADNPGNTNDGGGSPPGLPVSLQAPTEDLSVGGGWIAEANYAFDNNGGAPITLLSISGSIDPASTAVFQGGVKRAGINLIVNTPATTGGAQTPTVQFTCLTNQTTLTWSCTGATLGPDDAAPNGIDASQILIVLSGVAGAQGETIIFHASPPTCGGTPGPCTSGVVSLSNSDGGTLTPTFPGPIPVAGDGWSTHTDTLTP